MIIAAALLIVSCNNSSDEEIDDLTRDVQELIDELDQDVSAALDEQVNEKPEKFYSKEGKFKVSFSGIPEETKQDVETELVNFEMVMYIYEEGYDLAEMVAYSDYPPEIMLDKDIDMMLDDAKTGSVESMSLTIKEEKKFNFKGHKAIRFKADNSEVFVDYLIFMVGNRFFQAAVMKNWSYADTKDVDDFFESMEILNE
jgi:hypothetical protein